MRQGTLTAESGQALSGYALLLGGIAVACIAVVLALGGGIGDVFRSAADPQQPGTFRPPTAPAPSSPTSLAQCKHGGWRDFGRFESEAECKDYVRSLTP